MAKSKKGQEEASNSREFLNIASLNELCNYKKSGKLKFSADRSLLGLAGSNQNLRAIEPKPAGDRTKTCGRSNQNLRAIEPKLASDRTKTCGRSNQN